MAELELVMLLSHSPTLSSLGSKILKNMRPPMLLRPDSCFLCQFVFGPFSSFNPKSQVNQINITINHPAMG